jgi:hypothetical protein
MANRKWHSWVQYEDKPYKKRDESGRLSPILANLFYFKKQRADWPGQVYLISPVGLGKKDLSPIDNLLLGNWVELGKSILLL